VLSTPGQYKLSEVILSFEPINNWVIKVYTIATSAHQPVNKWLSPIQFTPS
jgi:hypothetical protein